MLLFNVVLESIFFLLDAIELRTKDTIFNKQTQFLAYADDIDIVSRSLEAVRGAYLALEAEAAKIRLINEQKTKYIIAPGNRMILDARLTVKSC
jgi:hypothetical protein